MRLTELHLDEARPAVPVHPRVTVVCGLDASDRRRVVHAIGEALRGAPGDVICSVDVLGSTRPLDAATVADLDLSEGVDVVLRALDLPGALALEALPVDEGQPVDEEEPVDAAPAEAVPAEQAPQLDPQVRKQVATALEDLRHARQHPAPPREEVLALAESLAAVRARLNALPAEGESPEAVAELEAKLEQARRDVVEAEAAVNPQQLDADDIAALEKAHDAVMEAEDRAERRFGVPGGRRRLEHAREAEKAILERLNLASYGEYLLRTSTLMADPNAPLRLTQARVALADVERVYERVQRAPSTSERDAAEREAEELRRRAVTLLGHEPEGEAEAALRQLLADPGPDAEAADDSLREALAAAGVDVGEDPVVDAETWLAAAPEPAGALEPADGPELDAPQTPAPPTPPAPTRADFDVRGVERVPLEMYVLSRVTAQRDVGRAGSLPLVLDDAFNGLGSSPLEAALGLLERFSPMLQVLYFGDAPEVIAWAERLGPDTASVIRG